MLSRALLLSLLTAGLCLPTLPAHAADVAPPSWLNVHLARWGRAGAMRDVLAAAPATKGARVELLRGAGLVEWFARDPRGVEQGFDVGERPAGEGELVFEVATEGLTPVLDEGARSVSLYRGSDAVLSYSELFVKDADGRDVPARLAVEGEHIAVHVDDRAARYPLVVDPLIYALRATLTDGSYALGKSNGLSGTTAVVGSDKAVTFFTGSGDTWTKVVRLFNSAPNFGTTLALDGDLAIAGAAGTSGGGFAQVFAKMGTTWVATKTLTPSGSGGAFGRSVGISGRLAIVGAPGTFNGTGKPPGGAYIYAESGGTWTQQARLAITSGTDFGNQVAISGATAIVTARTSPSGVLVFEQTGTTWTETAKLKGSDDTSSLGLYGIAISGTTALVGDTGANAAYVFVKGSSGWTEQQKLTPSVAGSFFGGAVAIDGDRAVVTDNTSLFVYERTGTVWSEKAHLSGGGGAVSVSGATILANAKVYGLAASVGDTCAKGSDCAGNICVDGVCCATACTGKCMGCSNAATGAANGTCALARDGADPHGDCVASGSVCVSGSVTNQVCNGAGACRLASKSCAPFMCTSDGKGCASSCSADTDCSASQYCSATGVCTTRAARGETCGSDRECTSRYCVDGVCCDTKCDGQCQACAEPGSVGSCVPVKGAPRVPRPGCAGDDVACTGTCDGTDIASCSYPSAGRTCGAGCVAGQISVCDARGACLPPSPCPGNFACDAPTNKCKATCVADSECESGFACNAGKCAPPPPVRCSDDRTQSIAGDGKATPCAPYKCGTDGACPTSCATSADCIGSVCDTSSGTGLCVPPPPGEDDGGCAFSVVGSRSAGTALGLLVLAGLARARRRRNASIYR